ncbi:MAG: hypothetical protein RI922_981 [Bacteroidota bacterium]|jgi:hypothetical protein
MEIKKVNLDRQNLSSSYIEKKQDFNHVLNSAKMTKMPTWKSPWFYGAVGLSSVAIVALVLTENNFKKQENDKKATIENSETTSTSELNVQDAKENKNKDIVPILVTKVQENIEPVRLAIADEVKDNDSETNSNYVIAEFKTESTQVPTQSFVEEKKNYKSQLMGQPTIAGIASGKINIENFRNTNLIESNSSFEITSYEVQYYNGNQDVTAVIRSNKIPEDIKEQIIKNNLDEMIFITGIKGIDESGKIRKLPSINLLITN